ncbi:AAA family ATPase [Tenacibaculum sp. 1_MG-2023]|uniref:AAA family ATPase n=1 Tax=Tenacibaculum sp. 1_MG-2023 TaxID=3062653 RepID=UPI0026E26DB8|nr:AAA family ATPase [Tenacibaculum sp. 1_MG-2023]MDO6676904.1 AAA family ATPase [Tenacibaculum sp. 1_MG-2023]
MTLEEFSIINLFKELNFKIRINENKLIIVSENGSGKTTILRMLYLFLSKQWALLAEYDFETISAIINGKDYTFNKNEFIIETFDHSVYEEIAQEFPTYKSFIKEILPTYNTNILKKNSHVLEDIENEYDVPKNLLLSIIDRLNDKIFDENLYDWEVSVIYLPTYRRIERNFSNLFGDMDRRLEVYLKNLVPELNARIDNEKDEDGINTEEDLKKIFSDLWNLRYNEKWKKEEKEFDFLELTEFGMDDVNIKVSEILKKIEEGDSELNLPLETFKNCCNNYLTNNKKIKVRKKSRTLAVKLNNSKKVKLKDLSSGEKQIVSIFCHLFLDLKKPIIIFDEPELSLSLDWQEKILTDVLKSNNEGLIVATHSPFVITEDLKEYTHGINEFIL